MLYCMHLDTAFPYIGATLLLLPFSGQSSHTQWFLQRQGLILPPLQEDQVPALV